MADAAYYRAWRAAHPDYRKRQRVLRRARRARMTPEQRRRDRGQRAVPLSAPLPAIHVGHDLFDHAKRMARLRVGFRYLTHPFYDDLVSEIVLALLEGRSGLGARYDFLRAEYEWRSNALQLRPGYEPVNGRLVAQSDDP